ncbi:ADP-ribosylglycohydrolase family protein [Caldicellulosiruptoraceae bacterium PP1]
MAGWVSLRELLKYEIIQKKEEGYDVTGIEEKLMNTCEENEQDLMKIYDELKNAKKIDNSFFEPSDIETIKSLRPNGPRRLEILDDDGSLKNKFYGAWLGRCVGCALGKPLEAMDFMEGNSKNPGWKNVMLWFKGADAWPIKGYTPSYSKAQDEYGLKLAIWNKLSLRENIKFMETDDDIRYTVLGLSLLEEKGLNWDTWDLGKYWHRKLPYGSVCTAETQAYYNFCSVTSYLEWEKPADWQKKIEWVRTHLNPYREWIGAQIRVDAYAYAAAGNPELAAELAWRDASFSHVKNGIYGAMFISAIIAAAFVEKDPIKLVEIGLSEIPNDCRLSRDIKKAMQIAQKAKDQEELVSSIWDNFNHYHCVHTINNAALCVAAIIFGDGDFEKAVTTAVLGGWDTDCNGATVGSIMGAMVGASNIPEYWISPLNDTLYSEIPGFHPIKISECAERSYNVYKKLNNEVNY